MAGNKDNRIDIKTIDPKRGAKLELDDSFTPTSVQFTECGKKIEIWREGEQCRIQVYNEEKFLMGMRLPLYALTAIAQMGLGALNGQQLPRNT